MKIATFRIYTAHKQTNGQYIVDLTFTILFRYNFSITLDLFKIVWITLFYTLP